MGKWVIFINTRQACLDLKLVSWFSEKFSGLFCNRALTIGQMQGKFQMVVVRHTGHAIQVAKVIFMPGLSFFSTSFMFCKVVTNVLQIFVGRCT